MRSYWDDALKFLLILSLWTWPLALILLFADGYFLSHFGISPAWG